MDDDIRENLIAVSRVIHSIADQIASPEADIITLKLASESLAYAKETVDTYVRMQKRRNVRR